jgi:hypothetical protein
MNSSFAMSAFPSIFKYPPTRSLAACWNDVECVGFPFLGPTAITDLFHIFSHDITIYGSGSKPGKWMFIPLKLVLIGIDA